MASRRDELNAYTFAKRRTLASFVQPSPSGSEEGAPRPLRAVLPGTIMGVVILAVFGGIGMFKPTAPKGWDATATNVIVASDSTTRYVVLTTGKQKQLHPVLNMASAKLLLKDYTDKVVTVDEGVLDNGKIPHGATLGIPYAPDRLPSAKEAEEAKRWMVCERPSDGGRAIQKAAFVFAQKDWVKKTEGRNQLRGGQLMYVADSVTKKQYVVDAKGTAYEIADPAQDGVLTALDTQQRAPQRVSSEWLKTLHEGAPITMPTVPGTPGQTANAIAGSGNAKYDKVGTVLKSLDGTKTQYYVVLQGKVARISEFTSQLLLRNPDLANYNLSGEAQQVNIAAMQNSVPFEGESDTWPTLQPETVNDGTSATSGRNTACNVLRKVGTGGTTLSTWVGTDFPADLPTGSSSAYVTPGSGQVFRQIQGSATKVGQIFLVTDTGLRYALQSNGDSISADTSVGTSAKEREELAKGETQKTQKLLGYDKVTAQPIPLTWSTFLPTGPRLSKLDAGQPQGS
ncbi:type VII secretion protein EccB [Streptomyces kunmingensis]|uniref:Type VII secretion protein EccB n=1 Tax=Streptomyces kunmingensis TaxID=68225 RepID=A0ABU6C7Y9_9ACTN|nr:type VII secretion protein EccB [Streptomyces kunmingensis]MEB3960450.1 type VII secretion protein EccB [Streptomyces kunmingensis]